MKSVVGKNKAKAMALLTVGALAVGAVAMNSFTYSAWTDSGQVATASVVNGNLDVEVVEPPSWRDINNNNSLINIGTFRAVPSDRLEYRTGLKVALEGNNLKAKLKLAGERTMFDNLKESHGWKIGFKIGTTAGGDDVLSVAPTHDVAQLMEGSELTPRSTGIVKDIAEAATANMFVTITVEFDPETPDQELVKATQSLRSLGVTLEQVLPNQ